VRHKLLVDQEVAIANHSHRRVMCVGNTDGEVAQDGRLAGQHGAVSFLRQLHQTLTACPLTSAGQFEIAKARLDGCFVDPGSGVDAHGRSGGKKADGGHNQVVTIRFRNGPRSAASPGPTSTSQPGSASSISPLTCATYPGMMRRRVFSWD